MTKDEDFFWTGKMKKSIEEMKELSKKKKINFGSLYPPPLLNIDLDHVVVDELHLMMRIVDVLLKNLIENAINLDQRENIWTKFKVKRHVTAIVEAIQMWGILFSMGKYNKGWQGRFFLQKSRVD